STPLAGRFGRRMQPSRMVAGGMALSGAGTAVFALVHDQPWQVLAAMSLRGLGLGVVFAIMPVLVLDAVPAERAPAATGLNNVLRTVGSLLGAQICATYLATLTIGDTGRPAEAGFVAAMWTSTGVALAGAAVALLGSPRVAAPRRLSPRAAALPL